LRHQRDDGYNATLHQRAAVYISSPQAQHSAEQHVSSSEAPAVWPGRPARTCEFNSRALLTMMRWCIISL